MTSDELIARIEELETKNAVLSVRIDALEAGLKAHETSSDILFTTISGWMTAQTNYIDKIAEFLGSDALRALQDLRQKFN